MAMTTNHDYSLEVAGYSTNWWLASRQLAVKNGGSLREWNNLLWFKKCWREKCICHIKLKDILHVLHHMLYSGNACSTLFSPQPPSLPYTFKPVLTREPPEGSAHVREWRISRDRLQGSCDYRIRLQFLALKSLQFSQLMIRSPTSGPNSPQSGKL